MTITSFSIAGVEALENISILFYLHLNFVIFSFSVRFRLSVSTLFVVVDASNHLILIYKFCLNDFVSFGLRSTYFHKTKRKFTVQFSSSSASSSSLFTSHLIYSYMLQHVPTFGHTTVMYVEFCVVSQHTLPLYESETEV